VAALVCKGRQLEIRALRHQPISRRSRFLTAPDLDLR
jgi:hypothetical protein